VSEFDKNSTVHEWQSEKILRRAIQRGKGICCIKNFCSPIECVLFDGVVCMTVYQKLCLKYKKLLMTKM